MRKTVEERCDHMRKIPDKEIEWAESQFDTKGYIYYKKFGTVVHCFCGACGGSYSGLWKASEDPFEADCQHLIKPAHNKPGKCERCGYETKYKAQGKVKPSYIAAKGRYVIGQRLGKEEFVFRIFDVNQVMCTNKKTEYDHAEYIRVFLRPGKGAQKDYYVHDPWQGWDYWIPYNLGGMRNIGMPDEALISPGTWKEIRNTPMFKYVPRPDSQEAINIFDGRQYPTVRYYEAAARCPDFEMIVKSGMRRLVDSLIWKSGSGYRADRATYWNRLGIYKHRVRELIENYGDGQLLKVFQLEKMSKARWKGEDIKEVMYRMDRCSHNEMRTLSLIYRHASPAKFERYIARIIQNEGCASFTEYIDYIRMRKQMGYDLSNEIILFPKELHRRHNEMVLETENEKMDKRKKEVLEKYPKIAEKYKNLSDKYSAAAAGYIIRPAKDAAEIVVEGRVLHHCVGGDMYLSAHNMGRSTILFLRHSQSPDVPFITVEIKGETVRQWYGAYDKKPEKEFFDGWLATYVGELKKRKEEKKTKKVAKTA